MMNMKQANRALNEMSIKQRAAVETLLARGYELEDANVREATLVNEDEMKFVKVNVKGELRTTRHA